jgi:hypothetical protein
MSESAPSPLISVILRRGQLGGGSLFEGGPGDHTTKDRLSWHWLRHSFASMLATDLALPATTLAELIGHADAGFTFRVYARDGRDSAEVVKDCSTARAGQGSERKRLASRLRRSPATRITNVPIETSRQVDEAPRH